MILKIINSNDIKNNKYNFTKNIKNNFLIQVEKCLETLSLLKLIKNLR